MQHLSKNDFNTVKQRQTMPNYILQKHSSVANEHHETENTTKETTNC